MHQSKEEIHELNMKWVRWCIQESEGKRTRERGKDLRTKKKGSTAEASLFTGLDQTVLERDGH